MDIEQKLQELKRRDRLADEGGGAERRERQHKEGKMSARERIEFLLDEGTFEGTDRFVTHRANDFGLSDRKYSGDGFITGHGIITGPEVIKTVMHEDVSKEKLGGATTHNETSGVAHFLAHDDTECLSLLRELLSFLPSNNVDDPPRKRCTDPIDRADTALDTIIP